MSVSIEFQIACVKREIAMRERVYPRWVEAHKMTRQKADHELDSMRAVLATLNEIASRMSDLSDLWAAA